MTDPIPLSLRFKGTRTYLHGTDIFNALVPLTGATGDISLRFHRRMEKPLLAFPVALDRADPDRFAGLFFFGAGAERRCIGLCETEGAVDSRYPYDEEAVVADARAEPGALVIPGGGAYTMVERLVAGHKALLRLEIPEYQGPWLFARLDLAAIPAATAELVVRLRQRLGVRLVRSEVVAEGRTVGSIFFSRG